MECIRGNIFETEHVNMAAASFHRSSVQAMRLTISFRKFLLCDAFNHHDRSVIHNYSIEIFEMETRWGLHSFTAFPRRHVSIYSLVLWLRDAFVRLFETMRNSIWRFVTKAPVISIRILVKLSLSSRKLTSHRFMQFLKPQLLQAKKVRD